MVHQLIGPEMVSGWGVRTLATTMGRYDPISYHNGSVWPHDTAIVAAGLRRAGTRRRPTGWPGPLAGSGAWAGGCPSCTPASRRAELSRTGAVPDVVLAAGMGGGGAAAAAADHPRAGARRPWWCRARRAGLPDGASFIHLAGMPLAGTTVAIDVDGDAVDVRGLPVGIAVERY